MQDANRAVRAWLGRLVATRPGLAARLRLFGLLVLLVPLFAGLQYLIRAGGPRVEIRFVAQDVPILVPVERIVERVVERIVYVPVPVEGVPEAPLPSPVPTVQPASTPTPSGADPHGAGVPKAGRPAPPGGGGVAANGE